MGYKIWDTFYPLAIHFLIMQAVALLFGRTIDRSGITLITAILTIPLFLNWYREDRIRWKRERKTERWWEVLCIALLAFLMNMLLSFLTNFLVNAGIAENTVQEQLFASNYIMLILGPGIFVPIAEELLFRGLLFQKLERYTGRTMAVFLGAAVFSLYHGNLIQMLSAFLMGIILNLLYRYYGTLKIPILFHIAFNMGSIIMSVIVH